MTQVKNPYPGIRPFRQEDSAYFFGRSHLTQELVGKLGRERFVAVVGSSGCGKSSLIGAGLIPYTLNMNWQVIVSRPQNDPLLNLANELRKDLEFQEPAYLQKTPGNPECVDEGNNLRVLWKRMIEETLNLTSQALIDIYNQTNSNKPLLL
ncbi:MAG: hypothetical protein C0490_19825, partial [Marivirga sp.]|nr:hypothetical protein [Marivirga sp.]